MSERPDPATVLTSLGFGPAAGAIEPVTGGWDTALWRFATADGARHALRLFRAEQRAPAEREHIAIVAAHRGGVPTPTIEAAGTWEGRPVSVLGWMPGDTMAAALQRRPWTVGLLGAALARTQIRLNALAAPAELLAGAPDYWLKADVIRDDTLIQRLRALPVRADRLVHLDYHPLNVLTEASEITAVLDWPNAAAGDPRADFARTAAILSLAPLPVPPAMRPPARLLLRLLHRSWARTYIRHSGPLRDLAPFLAWAGTEFARDTERRLGESRVWATATDVARMWRWVERWRGRTGLA
jgi:aminoglycoside phosphotransferase (APT) family kinase protein